MQIWLNGQFIPRDEAKVSIFDAGLQHGIGLFETMAARHGRVFRAVQHMRRLTESARALLLTDRLRIEPLIDAVELVLTRNALQDARVRLTVTGGDLNHVQSRNDARVDPAILIVAQPPTAYPEEFFSRGVRVTIADGRENPLDPNAGHKTLSYWSRIRALQNAAARQAGEALWFGVTNHLCGGSVSNAFLARDGALLTPIARGEEEKGAVAAPVLPGITRAVIFELAERMRIPIRRQMIDIETLLSADEVFLTNSSWGVLPVIGVEGETIGDGEVGSLTADLRLAYLARLEEETSEPSSA